MLDKDIAVVSADCRPRRELVTNAISCGRGEESWLPWTLASPEFADSGACGLPR